MEQDLLEQDLWNKVMSDIDKNRKIELSAYYSFTIDKDIKHLSFVLSRYKFASKMVENKKNIALLELGCNHGLGMQFFSQTGAFDNMVGVDFDSDAVEWAKSTFSGENINFIKDDFLNKSYTELNKNSAYDVIVCLDVIEHIDETREKDFLDTIDKNLDDDGVAIIGTPNITMSPYASKESSIGHINLYDQHRLYEFLSKKFNNVFLFGMNDEVVHTGFYPMCCYIMAVCVGKKKN